MNISDKTRKTLRRRIYDKMCKDKDILEEIILLAIGEGFIKFSDILEVSDYEKELRNRRTL